jgi:tetratricopeptide (TPR) repeat protein
MSKQGSIKIVARLCLFFLFHLTGHLQAQSNDSLKKLLQSLPPLDLRKLDDTVRCNVLLEFAYFGDDDTWLVYNKLLRDISEYRLNQPGLNTALKQKYHRYLASTYNEMGMMYREKSDVILALQFFQKSLEQEEKTPVAFSRGILYNNFAIVYYDIGDIDKALDYSLKSLALLEKGARNSEISQALTNIAYLYGLKNNLNKSLECNLRALTLSKAVDDQKGIAESYNSIGLIQMKQHHYDSALACYFRSLAIREEIQDKRGITTTLNNLGTCFNLLKQYKKALVYSTRALAMGRELKNVERLRQISNTLTDIHEALGNYQEAFKMHKLYIQMRDSTNNENTRKAALKAQVEYEYQKREIILKEEQNKLNALYEQKKQYYLIFSVICFLLLVTVFYLVYNRYKQKREKEKHNLLLRLKDSEIKALQSQMNPHFVFNTLNSVLEFIRRSEKDEAIKYLTKFSKLMRTLLESSSQKLISLSQELEFLKLYVDLENLRFGNSFHFELHVDPELDLHNTEMPTLIIQPFVENAILHGLQNKKILCEEKREPFEAKLRIDVVKQGNFVKWTIQDNGIGRKQAAEIKKNKAFSHHSIGVRVTQERLDLLGHEQYKIDFTDLTAADGSAIGTRVEIIVPLLETL